jgi:hypothetical protein
VLEIIMKLFAFLCVVIFNWVILPERGLEIMKTQMKHERVNLSYIGGKMILQNGKMRMVVAVTADRINLALGGKMQSNVLMDLDINS